MSKYGAIKTTVDGIEFASKREAERYAQLRLCVRGGLISDLEIQPEFPIVVNGVKCGKYIADFAYNDRGNRVVEDVKSNPTKTPVYRLKKKLVEALYGVKIIEVN